MTFGEHRFQKYFRQVKSREMWSRADNSYTLCSWYAQPVQLQWQGEMEDDIKRVLQLQNSLSYQFYIVYQYSRVGKSTRSC